MRVVLHISAIASLMIHAQRFIFSDILFGDSHLVCVMLYIGLALMPSSTPVLQVPVELAWAVHGSSAASLVNMFTLAVVLLNAMVLVAVFLLPRTYQRIR